MSSSATIAVRNRENGRRAESKHRGKAVDANFLGVANLGSNRLNVAQIYEIERLFNTHPAVQAARTVLHAQLFSGGIALFRDGKAQSVIRESKAPRAATGSDSRAPTRAPSEAGSLAGGGSGDAAAASGVKEAFHRHLETHWLDFAKSVADSFLKWGVCVVTFELETEDPSKKAARLAKEEERISMPARKRAEPDAAKRLVPSVPVLGTYEIGFDYVGRFGYTREYKVYAQIPGQSMQADDQAVVHVRQHPDNVGNVNSPLASVYELGSFVHSITELAHVAEISRATPQIVTQLRPPAKTNGLDPSALFFDSESRNVASGQDEEESTAAARALEMQAQLCSIINRLQTTNREPGAPGAPSSSTSYQPPDIQPKLFTIPKDQELAPTNKPEARSDLESLQRLAIEQIAAAMGVPASLVFEGRYAGKSSQQLQLLNSTVSQLSKSVNEVLTKTYLALYPDEVTSSVTGKREESRDTNLELKLRTAPLSASEEIVQLYTSNLIDVEIAVPAVLHSLGATSDEVEAALKRARARQDDDKEAQEEDRNLATQQKKLALERARASLEGASLSSSGGQAGGAAGGQAPAASAAAGSREEEEEDA